MTAPKPWPQYRCHKEVGALQIDSMEPLDSGEPGALVTFKEPGYEPAELPEEFLIKHQPYPTGYLVAYDDGYLSFSPRKPFEDGYTLITSN